jgi:hypothetical protein
VNVLHRTSEAVEEHIDDVSDSISDKTPEEQSSCKPHDEELDTAGVSVRWRLLIAAWW